MLSVKSIFEIIDDTSSSERNFRMKCDSQSTAFYSDMSRYMCRFLLGYRTYSILDVGPRTASGLALLRLLHHPHAFTRLKFDPVHGMDLDPEAEKMATEEFPDIKVTTGDIFDLPDLSYDIVMCSHTIEHVDPVDPFIEKLGSIARTALFIACPFGEIDRVPGHVNTITDETFKRHNFNDVYTYESNQWHGDGGLVCLAYKKVG